MGYHHPRARRLGIVLDLTRREEKDALQRWGDIQQRLTAEQEKRTQLDSYIDDYRRQITTPSASAVSAGNIHNSLDFIQQIESALLQQETQISQLEAQNTSARSAYLETHNKADALEKMIDRLEKEHQQEINRREQQESDEWANRRR
jgi:flagellar FliJ protein